VLELLGLRIVHGELPGRSLLSTDGHERLHHSCHYEDHCMALRQGSRKVVYHYGKRPTEVFELKADPLERRDLVGAKVVSAG
jgi:hypothetical protein